MLETLYNERGDVIDSLGLMLTNCDTVAQVAMRSMERERIAREAADRIVRDLERENTYLVKKLHRSKVWGRITTSLSIIFISTTAVLILN